MDVSFPGDYTGGTVKEGCGGLGCHHCGSQSNTEKVAGKPLDFLMQSDIMKHSESVEEDSRL